MTSPLGVRQARIAVYRAMGVLCEMGVLGVSIDVGTVRPKLSGTVLRTGIAVGLFGFESEGLGSQSLVDRDLRAER